MVGRGSKNRAGRIALWATGALALLAVLALTGYSATQRSSLQAQAARLAKLERRVGDMAADQRLLAAIVAAGVTTTTAAPKTQLTATTTVAPNSPGTQRVFGSIKSATKQPFGWELKVDPSQYVTGTAAFSVASSLGKLTNSDGSFVLDTSARTSQFKLLKDAKVKVASWHGSRQSGPRSVSAEELVAALPGGASSDSTWDKAWFWFDVRDGYVLQVTQQSIE